MFPQLMFSSRIFQYSTFIYRCFKQKLERKTLPFLLILGRYNKSCKVPLITKLIISLGADETGVAKIPKYPKYNDYNITEIILFNYRFVLFGSYETKVRK